MHYHLFRVFIFITILMPMQGSLYGSSESTAEEKPYLTMKSIYGMGFFQDFLSVMGALFIYEKGKLSGVAVNYETHGTYYDPTRGLNWWEYYFEPLQVGKKEGNVHFHTVNGDEIHVDLARHAEFCLHRQQAFKLIQKYIRVKPYIKQKINRFVKEAFRRQSVVGVHYRGTDKFHESRIPTFEEMAAHVDQSIAEYYPSKSSKIKIFVATDQHDFLDYMIARYPSQIIYYQEALRSLDGGPVHFSTQENNYKKGEDALIDCLLLSKCDILVKTSSNLSLCSAYFNPEIPMIHVTERPWRAPLE